MKLYLTVRNLIRLFIGFVCLSLIVIGIYITTVELQSKGDQYIPATELSQKIRVLCWIMTTKNNLASKATAVRNTWAPRCNKFIFFSSETNTSFPTIGLNITEGRKHLNMKTVHAFRFCYENYGDQFDWFLKTDDDTYVIVENLRYFLYFKDPEQMQFFGHKFKKHLKNGYFSGGAGYVLSRKALHKYVTVGFADNNSTLCTEKGKDEDLEVAKCMEKLNVTAGESLDSLGREAFHPFGPLTHFQATLPKWIFSWNKHTPRKMANIFFNVKNRLYIYYGLVYLFLIVIVLYIYTAERQDTDVQPLHRIDLTENVQRHRAMVRDGRGSDYIPATELSQKIRVLCWIMTTKKNLASKATAVRNTWAPRCNKFIFFSSETNTSFPTIGLNITEGRNHLNMKTVHAFRFCYENYGDQFDWFLKTDDDTYVIVENLRYFLYFKDPEQLQFFGHKFKKHLKNGYFSGGAGYVLSRKALHKYVTVGFADNKNTLCTEKGKDEDLEVAKCMEKLNVTAGESLDSLGREAFHPYGPLTHYKATFPKWIFSWNKHTPRKGLDCCSEYSITFHYMSPNDMYLLDFSLYHIRIYGDIPPFNSTKFIHHGVKKEPIMRNESVSIANTSLSN